MSHRICCYTLFDITQTGVMNRSNPVGDIQDWVHKRNTQCNFDTILQVISLRSQPEVYKIPIRLEMTEEVASKFGFLYSMDEPCYYWKFEFEIHHHSVFENGIIPMGALYNDCLGVPMISCDGQHKDCPKFLDTSEELRNIVFEVL